MFIIGEYRVYALTERNWREIKALRSRVYSWPVNNVLRWTNLKNNKVYLCVYCWEKNKYNYLSSVSTKFIRCEHSKKRLETDLALGLQIHSIEVSRPWETNDAQQIPPLECPKYSKKKIMPKLSHSYDYIRATIVARSNKRVNLQRISLEEGFFTCLNHFNAWWYVWIMNFLPSKYCRKRFNVHTIASSFSVVL